VSEDVGVSGESESVSWNASFMRTHVSKQAHQVMQKHYLGEAEN